MSSINCEKDWFLINHTCYQINSALRIWREAREDCEKQTSHLAIIDSESTRKALEVKLDLFFKDLTDIHSIVLIGLRLIGEFQWITGTPIATDLWYSGYPDVFNFNRCTAIAKWSDTWRLVQRHCNDFTTYICQTENRKLSSWLLDSLSRHWTIIQAQATCLACFAAYETKK